MNCHWPPDQYWTCLTHQSAGWTNAALLVVAVLTLIIAALAFFGKLLWRAIVLPLWALAKLNYRRFIGWLAKHAGLNVNDLPVRTIEIVPYNDCRWQMGKSKGHPALLLHAHLLVTNIYGHRQPLATARIGKRRTPASLLVRPTVIAPHNSSDVLSACTIQQPPKAKAGQPFTTNIYIVDQYGNEHRKQITFYPY